MVIQGNIGCKQSRPFYPMGRLGTLLSNNNYLRLFRTAAAVAAAATTTAGTIGASLGIFRLFL